MSLTQLLKVQKTANASLNQQLIDQSTAHKLTLSAQWSKLDRGYKQNLQLTVSDLQNVFGEERGLYQEQIEGLIREQQR